jgi:hypothetical protein
MLDAFLETTMVHVITGSMAMLLGASGVLWAQAVQVTIDVKPGDNPTTLERTRDGFVPVAILSTAKFDALTIDPTSVRIGPTGTEAEAAKSMQSDVDRDDRMDLQVLVRVNDLDLACDTKVIRLTAKTMSGIAVEGSEAVKITGCQGEAVSPAPPGPAPRTGR